MKTARKSPRSTRTSRKASTRGFSRLPTSAIKITVERPLRLNFHAVQERIVRLKETGAFRKLAESNKKDVKERVAEESAGRAEQEAILKMLAAMPQTLFKDAAEFEKALDAATKRSP